VSQIKLAWQSKFVLLVVLPFVAASVVLQAHWWAVQDAAVAIWTVGLSLMLALITWQLRAATPAAAFTGAVITASLMFSTVIFPYKPWQTALVPVLVVFVLSSIATRMGREQKKRLGTAEKKGGRAASQVAANLGFAALVSDGMTQSWLTGTGWFPHPSLAPGLLFAAGLAALAEAAADTVSSEVGQVLGGRPRMITSLHSVEAGTDGAISLAGTAAGVIAAGIVALTGGLALRGGLTMIVISWAGGVFGLFFDSLLGATLEQRSRLNNDAVNFLSTASAAAFSLVLLAIVPYPGVN
jgi:uncharacterized protein (TIGR00297 family)